MGGKPLARRAIFTYFPHSARVPDTRPPSVTVTSADWKLIHLFHQGEHGAYAYRFHHLKNDIGEIHDLAADPPDQVKALDAPIEKFLTDTKSVTPERNPKYDSAAAGEKAKKDP